MPNPRVAMLVFLLIVAPLPVLAQFYQFETIDVGYCTVLKGINNQDDSEVREVPVQFVDSPWEYVFLLSINSKGVITGITPSELGFIGTPIP